MIAVESRELRHTPATKNWCYAEAFSRHHPLLGDAEQERLCTSCVAIVGMGGVGGIHLATLARAGIGAFHLADPDDFEVVNFNRQHGASVRTLGRNKALVMAEEARAINPDVRLLAMPEAITAANVGRFLEGVDVLIDGLDFFALATRRLVYAAARQRGIHVVTAGPLGFGTSWLVFAPDGMSFDRYFDLHDDMPALDQLAAFAVGLAPRALHARYLDFAAIKFREGRLPSAALACHLCSGVAAAETLRLLLDRGDVRCAPYYCQFDPYLRTFRAGYLRGGNRHPMQRLKRWWLRRQALRLGWDCKLS
jgi:molybdopterin/thiamine biosynthesis adenylyltransferase